MVKESKVKILTFGELLSVVPAESDNKTKDILEKVYSENEVIATFERKGETYFVCRK